MKAPSHAQVVERLIALDGLLNMHERAAAAGVPCKLNGESRTFDMSVVDCGTAACLHGSAKLSPWFQERGYAEHLLQDFFGVLSADVSRIYLMRDSSGSRRNLTVPQVRIPLRAIILKVGGQKAIDTCERNKKRGDKLRMGLPS